MDEGFIHPSTSPTTEVYHSQVSILTSPGALTDWPTPMNLKELQRFLGFSNL